MFNKLILGSFGGPICDILKFSEIHDIFPNFLVAGICNEKKVDFALQNLRIKSGLSSNEKRFFHNLFFEVFDQPTKKFNQKLFLKLIKFNLFNLKQEFQIPILDRNFENRFFYQTTGASFFDILIIFGCELVRKYLLEDGFSDIVTSSLTQFQKEMEYKFPYVAAFSNTENLVWVVEYFKLKPNGTTSIDDDKRVDEKKRKLLSRGITFSLLFGKFENSRYLCSIGGSFESTPRDNLSRNMINSASNILRIFCTDVIGAKERVKTLVSMYNEFCGKKSERIPERVLLQVSKFSLDLVLLDLFEHTISFSSSDEQTQHIISNCMVGEKLSNFRNPKSVTYLFEKYPDFMKNLYSEDPLRNSIYFDQVSKFINLHQHKCNTSKINSYLDCAIRNGNFEIVKFLVDEYSQRRIFVQVTIQRAFMAAVSLGYYEIVKFLVDSEIINFDDNVFGGIFYDCCYKVDSNIENCLLRSQFPLDVEKNIGDFRFILTHLRKSDVRITNDQISSVEGEYCKILKLLLQIPFYSFNPRGEESSLICEVVRKEWIEIANTLLDDHRFDLFADDYVFFIDYLSLFESHGSYIHNLKNSQSFLFYLKILRRRDVESHLDSILTKLVDCRRFYIICLIYKKGKMYFDLDANDNLLIRSLVKNICFTNSFVEGWKYDFLKIILEDKRVDVSTHDNYVAKTLIGKGDELVDEKKSKKLLLQIKMLKLVINKISLTDDGIDGSIRMRLSKIKFDDFYLLRKAIENKSVIQLDCILSFFDEETTLKDIISYSDESRIDWDLVDVEVRNFVELFDDGEDD